MSLQEKLPYVCAPLFDLIFMKKRCVELLSSLDVWFGNAVLVMCLKFFFGNMISYFQNLEGGYLQINESWNNTHAHIHLKKNLQKDKNRANCPTSVVFTPDGSQPDDDAGQIEVGW